jgi:Putative auto-transporter adhesin, head GIN domain
MLKIITTLTIVLFGLLAQAQVTESRELSNFSKVEVKNGIQLIYTQSATPSLQVEARDEATIYNVVTEMVGNTLKIYLEKDSKVATTAKVYLSTPQVVALTAKSKAVITVVDEMTAKNLKLTLRSGAAFTGNIKATGKTKLTADKGTVFNGKVEAPIFVGNFKSNARVNLTGKVQLASISTTDTALLIAKNFVANTIHLNAGGKSRAMIHVDNDVVLNVTESAKVTYSGWPQNIEWNEEAEAIQKQNSNRLVSFSY